MKKVLILAGIPWNTSIQRHHKVAKWLIDLGYEVYFVEKIVSSKFSLKKVINKFQTYKIKTDNIINPTFGVKVINCKFFNPEFQILNRFLWIKKKKKIPNNFDIVINYLPIETTKYILSKITYKKLIYDCVRDFSNWGGYNKSIIFLEKSLFERADVIMTDSFYLTQKIQNKYANKVLQILPTFEKQEVNQSERDLEKSKIKDLVYFGQLGPHIDVDLLSNISHKYKINIFGDISVKLDFKYEYFGFFSDKKKLFELINQKADAIIIPYKGNMDGVIPAKLFESLATLKPVFISSFYDSQKMKDFVYVYDSLEDLKYQLDNFDFKLFSKKLIKIKKLLKESAFQEQKFENMIKKIEKEN